MTGLVEGVFDSVAGLPLWAMLGAVWVFMALETSMLIGVLVPGDVLVLLTASTVTTPTRGAALVAAITLGSLTGETCGYLLGRRFGPRLRRSRLGRTFGEDRWQRAAAYLDRRGGRALVSVRFLAALHAVVPLVAGTVRMRYRRFAAWCATGGVIWATLYVILGTLAGASYRQWADRLSLGWSVVAAVLVGVLVVVGLVARQRRRRMSPAGPCTVFRPAACPVTSDDGDPWEGSKAG